MEAVIKAWVDQYKNDGEVTGVLVFHNQTKLAALTDRFDLVVLVITREDSPTSNLFHYIKDGYRIQERRLTETSLRRWAYFGPERDVIRWILQGEIVLDKELHLESFRNHLLEFPESLKEQKLLVEFSLFVRTYLQSKEYVLENHLMDAYGNLLEALHHWARMAIIEQGIHPEVTVWQQIRRINPGVYKLYEELTSSGESLLQRVQLVLLACEFSVVSKMESCCRVLLRILESREEPWSVAEIQDQKEMVDVQVQLSLLLNKLVQKSLIREVAVPLDDSFSRFELRYTR
ncbi:nucleotidyltransferase-like protein [Paenibacillus aurantius]|uniref:Nucleotidyltransferase-like protein n=1 Tax=Paenibacillus aurantius TaxID=2918900 RepID=A0AA96LER7_9BACL|nr:nucleotidyltransferase-like protein [Paenibacillus aurantius]WNQ12457.1 nucleotidyltransferase-like protein [Paenibacillus aurantius]